MLITTKFPGTCSVCARPVVIGDRISWHKGIREISHAACSSEGQALAAKLAPSHATDTNMQIPAPDGLSYLGYQKAGIAYALACEEGTLIGDEMGLGKQQPIDAKVLTPTGWTPIGELSVGSYVIGSNGMATTVTGIFPQGVKPSYRVTFSDHSSVEAGPEHLWTVVYRCGGRRWKELTLTTEQLRERPKIGTLDLEKTTLYLPMLSGPVEFVYRMKSLPLDPYTLGALIANGSMLNSSAVLSMNALDLDEISKRVRLGSVNIYGGCARGSVIAAIGHIRNLQLDCKSALKFIPIEYLRAEPKHRIALLQGLLDGDGSISKTRNRVTFHSTSKRLARDVQALVEELGGIASIRTYDRFAENKPTEYQVRMRLPLWVKPFYVSRKADRYKPGRNTLPCRTVSKVEYTRDVKSVCISVAASDQLYATEHCILTHNTIQAIGIVNASHVLRVLVVCPASLKLNWRNEFRKWLTRPLSVDVFPTKSDITIINYDQLKKLPKEADYDLLILDEAHYIKNPKSQRSKLVASIAKRSKKVVALTGTPIANRPIELWSILQIVAPKAWDPAGLKGQALVGAGEGAGFFRFAKRFCDAKKQYFGRKSFWDFTGSSNLVELQEMLRSTCMVRRLKKDVLTELPAKRRVSVQLPKNGSADLVDREFELAGDFDIYNHSPQTLNAKLAFTEISKARRELALSKVDAVVEHVKNAFESSEKIVLFAHHREVIEKLTDQLAEFHPVVITGETPNDVRQANVEAFQTEVPVRLIIGSIGAMGVGLTLTAASHVIFAELDWVPANVSQAEDRCHRIGQKDMVLVEHLVVEGSLDARMVEVIIHKQEIADLALDTETMQDVSDRAKVEKKSFASIAKELGVSEESIELMGINSMGQGPMGSKLRAQLRYLASRCDGAVTEDGAGFNKLDARAGKSLARLDNFTPAQFLYAHKMLVKYRAQLIRGGL